MIKLSIIIPHFNGSELLEKLLSSIPQNQKEIQTIVVDDMSESRHLKIIEEFKNKYYFEFYQNNMIKSSGLCRNIGIDKAKGDWLLFADSDDYFYEGFYEKITKYLNKNYEVIFFSLTSQYIDTGELADRHFSFKKKVDNFINDKSKKNELLLRYDFISPWSKMIKKEFINKHKIRFDEGPIGAEDVMLSTKIGFFMKYFDVSKDIIYCRVVRKGSITRIFSEDQFDIRLNARISRIKFLNQNLTKKDLNLLNKLFICNKSSEFLLNGLQQFGYKKFYKILKLYQKESIQWFRLIYLNPIKIIKYIMIRCNNYYKNYKYNIDIK